MGVGAFVNCTCHRVALVYNCIHTCALSNEVYIFLDLYHSDLPIVNNSRLGFSEGDDLYTEVKEQEEDYNGAPCMELQNENPLYETSASDVDMAVNPIYDGFVLYLIFVHLSVINL